jgi:hypothetical protein
LCHFIFAQNCLGTTSESQVVFKAFCAKIPLHNSPPVRECGRRVQLD